MSLLTLCKCGTSWSKEFGYFERTSDMVFALERRVTKKGKNSVKVKQAPVVRYKSHAVEDIPFVDEEPAETFEDDFPEEQPPIPVTYSELDGDAKDEVLGALYERIYDFFDYCGYVPRDKEKREILDEICKECSEIGLICDNDYNPQILVSDSSLEAECEKALKEIIENLKADGEDVPTFVEYLTVMETERLILRKFVMEDLQALFEIMSKSEVMYAWERGFKKKEVRKWIRNQINRYHKDGVGYYAVLLKETGEIIGQAGLLKTTIDGSEVVEIGYIFDDRYWHKGYATESAEACVKYGFEKLGIDRIVATVRPENTASIAVAERLGMTVIGEYDKEFDGKVMRHLVYEIRKG